MNINITGRKFDLKDSFKARVEKKLSKFNKFFDEDAQANVTVTIEKNRQTVEVTIKSGGMFFRAEDTAYLMEDALDKVVDYLVCKMVFLLVSVTVSKKAERLVSSKNVFVFEKNLECPFALLPRNFLFAAVAFDFLFTHEK